MRVILASSSITRRKIMDELNIKYDIVTSDIDEVSTAKDPCKYVEELSLNKAEDTVDKVLAKPFRDKQWFLNYLDELNKQSVRY